MIGLIYCINDLTNNNNYIGSCRKENWSDRKSSHRTIHHNQCASKIIIENNNYIFKILEQKEFDNVREMEKLEQYYIDITNNIVNKQRAYRTEEQKKEDMKKTSLKWKENNRERKREIDRNYYNNNKEIINEKRKKEYVDKRKNYFTERNKHNKESRNRKVCCIKCKKELLYNNLKRHNKSFHNE